MSLKDATITGRVTARVQCVIEAAAAVRGVSVSRFVGEEMERAARRELLRGGELDNTVEAPEVSVP